jgi:hypothetical protein
VPLEGSSALNSGIFHSEVVYGIVMWNDIDLYHAFRDFTSDPVTFPGDEVRKFVRELVHVSWLVACSTLYLPLLFLVFIPPKV